MRDFFVDLGYYCNLEYSRPYRRKVWKTRLGRIDLLVYDPLGRHSDIAVEIDKRGARSNSVEELLLMQGTVRMLLVLGSIYSGHIPPGIHYMIGLPIQGWHMKAVSSSIDSEATSTKPTQFAMFFEDPEL